MLEQITDRVRKIKKIAVEEAQRRRLEFISPELFLLALLKHQGCIAVTVLQRMGVDLQRFVRELSEYIPQGNGRIENSLPYCPLAKRMFALGMEESRRFNHQFIGTEHVLLGLIQLPNTNASTMLMTKGVGLERTREEILEYLKEAEVARYRAPAGQGTMRLSCDTAVDAKHIPESLTPLALALIETLKCHGPKDHDIHVVMEFPLKP